MTEAAQPDTSVNTPALEGSTAEANIGTSASEAPTTGNEWLDVATASGNEIMSLPTIMDDGGKSASRIHTQAPLVSAQPPGTEAPPAQETETPAETETPEGPSFVSQANAERERLYQTRTAEVRAREFERLQAETQQIRESQQHMMTPQQVGETLRKDPFAFMRKHGVGLADLNKDLDAGKAKNPEPGVSKEVFELQQQIARTNTELSQMRQSAAQTQATADRSHALSTLQTGLTEYKDSYPGLHALWDGSTTTPAEQVLIGLENAQAAGRPMSANEVAGRLEMQARKHFDRLTTAYAPAPTAPTQHPPNAVHPTAGITNQAPAPVRLPGRHMTRQEEIHAAASLLRFRQ